ncbi:MAG: hypothetical protein I3273_02405 [Candidatus Moeniiplasma glomeromycotorum]|nr:hypothetical protein [Candidatus Moeniiplasma glomeromycotorum]MCE8167031.1 hypothetical protein [Candidatus Moeniiplasma glomeromycotorum]MCE8168957.1 hypothetical protein [Candidatus Moeniiplasma glomeromycotorum]
MNQKKEIQKIKVNNGQELIAKAREYKNSGGEWKLRERYIEMPTGKGTSGGEKKYLEWGIIIGNGDKKINIRSAGNNVKSRSGPNDEVNNRDELEKLFPEAKKAPFTSGENGLTKLNYNTLKRIKEAEGEYDLVRYLVAENFWHLKVILYDYVRDNETKIYQSANPHFSGWVEIVDGRDGNVYLYVGEKNENGGREIKIGIKKEKFYEKSEHNFYIKNGSENETYTSEEMLELAWNLFTVCRPRTPAEEREYYSKNGGLEQEWQRNWPHRQGLCRKYLEELRERMNQKFNYWQAKTKQKNHWDHEANEQGILAHAHMGEIDYYLTDMKKNRLDYYAACDKDCAICGVKLCCHFGGRPCEKSKNNLFSPDSKGSPAIGFHNGRQLPAPTPKNNQISETDKKQLLQYFLTHGISKISVENGQLKIEYSQKGLEVNSSELEKYRQFIQNSPSHSISLRDLQQQSNSHPSQTNPNKLVIGLTVGAGATIFIGGIVIYFWKNRRLKRD